VSRPRIERGTVMHVKHTIRRGWLVAAIALAAIAAGAPAALAAPAWQITAQSNTTAPPGGTVTYYVNEVNVGTTDTDGSTITTTVDLPAGLTAVSAGGTIPGIATLSCTAAGGGAVAGATSLSCPTTEILGNLSHSGATLNPQYIVVAQVDPGVALHSTLTSAFGVSGGGAPAEGSASTSDITRVDDPPGFGIANFDNATTADATGTPSTQAGGHPYAITTSIDFNTVNNPLATIGDLFPAAPPRDVVADLPPGLVGSTAGVDQCTASELARSDGIEAKPLCPATSQVGSTLVRLNGQGVFPYVFGPIPVFNMVPPPGAPAEFGFNLFGSVVTLTARLRSGTDYGLSVDASNIPESIAIAGTSLTFWGVPSDASHDSERACPGQKSPWQAGPTCPSGARPSAFLRNPTSCVAPAGAPTQDGLVTNLSADSWNDPGARDGNGAPLAGDPRWQTASVVAHDRPGYPLAPGAFGAHLLPTGCDKVPFDPTLKLQPTAPARAGMPTGIAVDLDLPQTNDPTLIGESDLKRAVVTLPQGMSVSPSSADGLAACSPTQIGLHSTADPACPDSSKIGTVEIATPLIDQHLTGSVFLASQNDNPFHSLLAIYVVAQGAGVTVKLAGHVEADPSTGQLTTTFDDNPQVPFSKLHLEFMSGPRAPLVAPAACGTYTTHAALFSWSQPDVEVDSDSSFTVSRSSDGSACAPAGFAPGFSAGSDGPEAGKSSPFRVRLTRADGDQQLSALTVDAPTGLLGKIASTVLCPDGAANAGSCTDGSRIGSVTVGAGAGASPFYIQDGRAYITGPYKGAPYGLSIVVPAVAGPFDLGNVIVRAAIFLDRTTTQLHVVSDPLPTILQGIPLDVRDVRVAIDKPGFIVNPTSCAPKRVAATVGSTAGAVAHLSSHFQVANCATLRFAPKLALTVGDRHHTKAGISTPLTATLTMPSGSANLHSVSVTLPGTINALLPVINRACNRADFNAGHCTSATKVGTAVAVTPLLRDPLRGSAYFVKTSPGHLPDLMVALRGPIAVDLTGKVSIPGGKRLGTTFNTIPDAPITKFTLRIVSGRNGPVGVATNLCSAKGRSTPATLGFRGQNNALVQVNQRVKVSGCPRAPRTRRARLR
jgi:hypothetical protein